MPPLSGLISPSDYGAPHDHAQCPTPPRVTGDLVDGHASHWGTPINPKHDGQMINIYGEGETDYLGFRDFATEAKFANGRPLTTGLLPNGSALLPDGTASDIFMRSSPISAVTESEIKRIARPAALGGCRFTYASNPISFKLGVPRRTILGLGQVIQQAQSPLRDTKTIQRLTMKFG